MGSPDLKSSALSTGPCCLLPLKGMLKDNSDHHFTFAVTTLGKAEENKNFFLFPAQITREQVWRSGESNCLPPIWLGIDSLTRRNMWVEFVIGSLLCSERVFSGYSGFPLS